MCRLIYDVISDVILLNFTNFTTSSPFWTTRIDFYEISMRSKVLWYDQRKIFAKYFFNTMSGFLIYVVINDFILLCFTDSTTSSPFWATSLDFYEMFIISKVVQQEQRKIFAKYYFDTIFRFLAMTSFVKSFYSISIFYNFFALLEFYKMFGIAEAVWNDWGIILSKYVFDTIPCIWRHDVIFWRCFAIFP